MPGMQHRDQTSEIEMLAWLPTRQSSAHGFGSSIKEELECNGVGPTTYASPVRCSTMPVTADG